jgi:hypothetical protein
VNDFAELVAAIERHTGHQGRRNGKHIRLLCPGHDDHHPSLDVAEGDDGTPLVFCRSHGCAYQQILDAIGWERREPRDDEPVAIYTYTDEQGVPLFEVGRFPPGHDGRKRFFQRRPGAPDWKGGIRGVRRVLYGLPEVVEAVAAGRAIWIPEGEKHADLLRARGRVATTSPMGAGKGKWKRDFADSLAGAARVFVLPDDDTEGREHADEVARSLQGRVGELKVVELFTRGETKRDVVDFYADADTPEQADRALVEIVQARPVYEPPAANSSGAAVERVRLTKIADVTPRRVEWVVEGLIARGMLTGLVAPGGTVKGLLGIAEAAMLATRDEKTLFVCSEDALDYIVRPRFQAAGCDAQLAFAFSIETATGDRVPHFPSDLPLLASAIAEVRPALVIVDPIASYIDPGLDMGKNNEMRLILQPLITLAADAYVAILVVYHLGKHRERGAIGSVAFEDACRQVLTAARDDEDEDVRHVELTKSNIGPTGYGRRLRIVGVPLEIEGEVVDVAKLVDEGRSWKSVKTLLSKKGPPGPEPEKRELARELLVDALVAGGTDGVNADEAKRVVAEKAGVSAPTVWRAFTELKAEELATGRPIRDELGSILEWRWVAKLALLVGRNDA